MTTHESILVQHKVHRHRTPTTFGNQQWQMSDTSPFTIVIELYEFCEEFSPVVAG